MPQTTSADSLFRRESEMARPVVNWLSKQGLMIKAEFVLPWGIPDLVAVRLRESAVRLRLRYGQRKPIGPASRVQILWGLPDVQTGKAVGTQKLQRQIMRHYDTQELGEELERLRRDKFAVSPQPGRYQKLNGWAPLHARIVAVELKLANVSEAFNQALLNRGIATESYVALPARIAQRVLEGTRAKEFRATGIGLVSVALDKCRVLIRPGADIGAFDEILQAHCVERFWRTRDSSS